jgi:hypothetical protein
MTTHTERRRGFTVRLFVPSGSPTGLRIVGKTNWNGVVLSCPRASFDELASRDELDRAGVYVLLGTTDEGIEQIYIGEGDPTRPRIERHHREKDFWTHLIVCTRRDATLNKAHVQHLEAQLVAIATKANRVRLDNANTPQLPSLSEEDEADVVAFLDDILLLLPLLGVSAFVATDRVDAPVLVMEAKGAKATGHDGADGFVVREGSTAAKELAPSIHNYLRSRRQLLIDERVLVEHGSVYRFARDCVFDSPSAAAGVVAGRSANGRIEWTTRDGRTLRDLQESAGR